MKEVWEVMNETGKEKAKDFGFEMEVHIVEDTINAVIKLPK